MLKYDVGVSLRRLDVDMARIPLNRLEIQGPRSVDRLSPAAYGLSGFPVQKYVTIRANVRIRRHDRNQ